MEKRPIASTLRAMKVGDVEYFPLKQYPSLRNVSNSTLRYECAMGVRFAITPEDKNLRVRVKRLS